MADRSTLHQVDFAAFKAFAEGRGYKAEPTKDEYEVLRLRGKTGSPPLLFHQRLRSEHATAQSAEAYGLVRAFIREKRAAAGRKAMSEVHDG